VLKVRASRVKGACASRVKGVRASRVKGGVL
jgi:hypothetical protein